MKGNDKGPPALHEKDGYLYVDEQELRDQRSRTDGATGGGGRLELRRVSAIEPRAVTWAWDGRIPVGFVTLLVGREGAGKGVLTAELAARLSRGELAGDFAGTAQKVAIVSAEDTAAHVIRPRLQVAGADRRGVVVLDMDESGLALGLRLPDDGQRLVARLRAMGIKVVFVDSIAAHLPMSLNGHVDQHVRTALEPLIALAARDQLAVIVTTHLNRAPTTALLDRVAGSLGLSRAARAVLAIAPNPSAPDERVVVVGKSNLGPGRQPALRFRIEAGTFRHRGERFTAPRLAWLGETATVTDGNVLVVPTDDERTAVEEAEAFLENLLAEGPVHAKLAVERAREERISSSTLRRARKRLGVRTWREGYGENGKWWWELERSPIEGQGSA